MSGSNNSSGGGPRSKGAGIHHANIRNKDKAVKRLKSSFRKIGIHFTLEKEKRTVPANVVLTEITQKSAYLFSEEKVAKNSWVTVHLREPLKFDVRGRVRYCEAADKNSTLSKTGDKPNYRLLIEFDFPTDLEREVMQDFYHQVRDETYAATRWHHYTSEKSQADAKKAADGAKMAETVKAAQEQPELATNDMLVTDKPVEPIAGSANPGAKKPEGEDPSGQTGGQSQAA